MGTDYFDLIHIHDIEYQGRKHTEWALTEGYESVLELKREGRIGGVSFGIYPMDLWMRIFSSLDVDAALVHNHYCLNDTRRKQGSSIAKLALQFASQNPSLPTTLFSSANPESVRRNVEWHQEPVDLLLVAEVQKLLEPVRNKQWDY